MTSEVGWTSAKTVGTPERQRVFTIMTGFYFVRVLNAVLTPSGINKLDLGHTLRHGLATFMRRLRVSKFVRALLNENIHWIGKVFNESGPRESPIMGSRRASFQRQRECCSGPVGQALSHWHVDAPTCREIARRRKKRTAHIAAGIAMSKASQGE